MPETDVMRATEADLLHAHDARTHCLRALAELRLLATEAIDPAMRRATTTLHANLCTITNAIAELHERARLANMPPPATPDLFEESPR